MKSPTEAGCCRGYNSRAVHLVVCAQFLNGIGFLWTSEAEHHWQQKTDADCSTRQMCDFMTSKLVHAVNAASLSFECSIAHRILAYRESTKLTPFSATTHESVISTALLEASSPAVQEEMWAFKKALCTKIRHQLVEARNTGYRTGLVCVVLNETQGSRRCTPGTIVDGSK